MRDGVGDIAVKALSEWMLRRIYGADPPDPGEVKRRCKRAGVNDTAAELLVSILEAGHEAAEEAPFGRRRPPDDGGECAG